jgi:hypothetical protein
MHPLLEPTLAQTDAGNGMGFITLVILAVVLYIALTVPVYKIAERLNEENAWMAFVPIANLFLLASMAGKEWWWALLVFVPLLGLIILIILWMGVADNLGHPSWMGILMIVPLINIALLYYWAFGPAPAARY